MIDINILRTNKDYLRTKLDSRNEKIDLEELINLDKQKRALQTEIDLLRNQRKNISTQIGQLKKQGLPVDELTSQIEQIKLKLDTLEKQVAEIEPQLNDKLLRIPNIPDDNVPIGTSEKDNIIVRQSGEITRGGNNQYSPHWEVGERLQILDFETASKISGSRFAMLRGLGAKLERAIINFMLQEHISRGYEEVWLPYLVTKESITGTGQLPKFEVELYKCYDDQNPLYLIPTAEVSLMNIHKNEIIPIDELPKKYVSYSACFRRESGSYGKDTKGLIRNHQFNKIELVKFVLPENSDTELETMVLDAENVLKKLGLTYRVVQLCTAELGFASAKTYDLEVWMPGENRWREISSCSNCKDFQARRLNIKYREQKTTDKPHKLEFVHTLNGSGVAVGRTFACILETYQQQDGTLKIPSVLKPFMERDTIP